MMLQPARRDGAIGGISIGTLFHVPVVPAAITPGPLHDVTYNDVHFECGAPKYEPQNSTCYTSHTAQTM